MHDPYFDHRLSADAIPPLARLGAALLSFGIFGVVVLSAIITAAG
jgi:hypothetical protein